MRSFLAATAILVGTLTGCETSRDSGGAREVDSPAELRDLLESSGIKCRDYETAERAEAIGPPAKGASCVILDDPAILKVFGSAADREESLDIGEATLCRVSERLDPPNPAYAVGPNWVIQTDLLDTAEEIAERLDASSRLLCD